jgi:hypothetical protein
MLIPGKWGMFSQKKEQQGPNLRIKYLGCCRNKKISAARRAMRRKSASW